MFRIAKMSGQWLAYDFGSSIRREAANIEILVLEGTPVLIAENLADAAKVLEIGVGEIQIVEPE